MSGPVFRCSRRRFLAGAFACAALPCRAADAAVRYPAVIQGVPLRFPADFGSHPEFRNEWWYITGWLQDERGAPLGMQITFFRHRPGIGEDSPSRFAPRQLLLAHAALADPEVQRLHHGERAARAGFGLAEAHEGNTDVRIDDWLLRRAGDVYEWRASAGAFAFELGANVRQRPLLQGDNGYSRKGPRAEQASYYYSEPQLAVSGSVTMQGQRRTVTGVAWCDHEWSTEYMPSEAAGWDWTGINFDDGGALMAFVMRGRDGAIVWAGGRMRHADGSERGLGEADVRFTPRRAWRSPRTRATYPVAMTLDVAGARYTIEPLFDDQELDARGTAGVIYWEGAVRASRDGRQVGRGYLELTGYAGTLRM